MKHVLISILFLLIAVNSTAQSGDPIVQFEWGELPYIPPESGQELQPGLAGAFTGIHNDALIIAGGANFPNGMVWDGGAKVYHRTIYVLEKEGKNEFRWFQKKRFELPRNIAYGLTVPTPDGLVCIGGMDVSALSSEVYLLKWNKETEEIKINVYPSLPEGMANLSGGLIDNKIYVAGSSEARGSKYFGVLDLANIEAGWQSLPVWDGAPRTHAVGVVQNNGETDCFYLIKGRFREANGISTQHTDSWVYNPNTNLWHEIKDKKGLSQIPLSAGTGVAVGVNHVLLFGGDDGQLFNRLENLAIDIKAASDSIRQNFLINERDKILKNHPGFSKDIWAFHTITHAWSRIGELPHSSQVTTSAFQWEDKIVIPSGEIAPSVRTSKIHTLQLSNKTSFGKLNYFILAIYLLLLVAIGIVFSKKQRSTEDFFKGGKRIPWWAAGLSIFGTQLSAITFMAIPAKTFATDWLYFFLMMTIIMVSPIIIRYFLPFYRRFNLTTAYEYLELRFNLATRLLGSLMYVFLQLGRLGIVLLLPSLALSVVTGIDVNTCILTMGILSILYTVLGGIEAVIWTDVVQVIVLLGGALLSLIILYFNLDSVDISNSISEFRKTRIFDFQLSLSEPTLWVVLIGGLAANIVQYGSDQTVIQRYLTTKDERSAAKSIMTGAWLTLPATLIFFTLGTMLFVYYKVNPELLTPILDKTDSIFPWYIVSSLPQGVSGLLIAAVFAASMSSLDSSMNSVSTVITTDYFHRSRNGRDESDQLKFARLITIVIGIIGTGIAVMMASWGISSLWDQFNMIVGLFAGGLGGIFLLGIFSTKANGSGALIGLLASGIIQYLIKDYTSVHLLMYAFTGMASSIVIGWLASIIVGRRNEEKLQFTYYRLRN